MGILQSPCSGNCFIDRQEVQGHSKHLNGEGGGESRGKQTSHRRGGTRGKQTSYWRGGPGANKHHIGEEVQEKINITLERGPGVNK